MFTHSDNAQANNRYQKVLSTGTDSPVPGAPRCSQTNLRQPLGLEQNPISPRHFPENTPRLAMSPGWQGAAFVTVLHGQALLQESHVHGLAPKLQQHDRKYYVAHKQTAQLNSLFFLIYFYMYIYTYIHSSKMSGQTITEKNQMFWNCSSY